MDHTGNDAMTRLHEYLDFFEYMDRAILTWKGLLDWQSEHGSFDMSDADVDELIKRVNTEIRKSRFEYWIRTLETWMCCQHLGNSSDFQEEDEQDE